MTKKSTRRAPAGSALFVPEFRNEAERRIYSRTKHRTMVEHLCRRVLPVPFRSSVTLAERAAWAAVLADRKAWRVVRLPKPASRLSGLGVSFYLRTRDGRRDLKRRGYVLRQGR